jgi:hypothetical protein
MSIDRRTLLKLSAAGIAGAALPPATAFAGTEFPPVPGMLGDRRANEMWYQFDEIAFYNAAPDVLEAYRVLGEHVGGPNFVDGFWDVWLKMSALPEYPRNYTDFLAPVKPQLELLSRLQLSSFDKFYTPNSPGFIEAFSYFGQGVLFDPRRAAIEQEVHTMYPITGYHGWHAYLRAMMLLGISRDRWARINPVIGFAWAVQSVAKPSTHVVSPALPQATVSKLALSWLPRPSQRLDQDFRSTPYPAGIS